MDVKKDEPPKARTLVVGIGEVGAALAAVLDRKEPVLRHDLDRVKIEEPIGTMHLCVPFQSPHQFETVALGYIDRFKPALTIINSTVLPGTTRSLSALCAASTSAWSRICSATSNMSPHRIGSGRPTPRCTFGAPE